MLLKSDKVKNKEGIALSKCNVLGKGKQNKYQTKPIKIIRKRNKI